jgi:Flp pilus assembly protein TadB
MRRLPAKNVFVFSLLAAVACLILAVWLSMNQTLWALLPAALTVWFAVDSWRAWSWSKEQK